MLVYHEITPDALGTVLQNGLKKTSRGAKGSDKAIIQTDQFLDKSCPEQLKSQGVSRDDNVYAYIRDGDSIIDITNGEPIPLRQFIKRSKQKVLELDVNPSRCFVSDLDTYDALKEALINNENQDVLDTLASSYWSKVAKLTESDATTTRRPEILITYDVPAGDIRPAEYLLS
mgnify:CR=1 FL=1